MPNGAISNGATLAMGSAVAGAEKVGEQRSGRASGQIPPQQLSNVQLNVILTKIQEMRGIVVNGLYSSRRQETT